MVDVIQEAPAPALAPNKMEAAMAVINKAEAEEVKEVVQETKVEAQAETPQPEGESDSRVDLWSKLAERDKEIRKLKTSAKTDLREMVKTDPRAVLRELGIGLDQVFDLLAGGPVSQETQQESQQEEHRGDDELSKLRSELEQFKAEQAARAHEEVVRGEHYKIHRIAESDKERWELVNSLIDEGSVQLVLDTASETFKLTQELPKYDEVMDTVEKYLEEDFAKRYEKLNSLKKVQSRFSMGQNKTKAQQLIESPAAAAPTLSTSMTGGPSPRGVTEQERMQRALALIEKIGD
jgi:hypothetical protein